MTVGGGFDKIFDSQPNKISGKKVHRVVMDKEVLIITIFTYMSRYLVR